MKNPKVVIKQDYRRNHGDSDLFETVGNLLVHLICRDKLKYTM